jgi:diguanylate cyclase (GGDEF)-like protein
MEELAKNSVLIVDDDKLNLKVLTNILSAEYTIYTAKDGPTALEMAEEYSPDLILLDIIMPGMDGYEVLAALKKSEKLRETPVIFITGLDSSADEEKGLTLGAADYISKPFNAMVTTLRVRHQIRIVNQIRIIERLSMVDTLTNLANRRSFNNRLHWEWRRSMREKTPISILILDLDKFKTYNDTYGHLEGDALLKAVAKIFADALKRSDDFIARWGGEEFIALLSHTDIEGAFNVGDTLRENVESAVFPLANGQNTKVTVSIGTNTIVPTQECVMEDFISKADKALYIAKETGRNRVCQYKDE